MRKEEQYHDGLSFVAQDLSPESGEIFPEKGILSIYPDEIFRYTYGDYFKRTCQLANALESLGIEEGGQGCKSRIEQPPAS